MKTIFRVTVTIIALIMLTACATPAPTPTFAPAAANTPAATPTTAAVAPREPGPTETRVAESTPANATPRTNTTVPPIASFDPQAIPASFFAMTTVNENDYPKLSFGTLAHPEIGAWAWIEQKKGVYDFSLFDKYVTEAAAHGLVDSTNTVSLAITLGETPPWAAADPRSCKTERGLTHCTSGPANIQD